MASSNGKTAIDLLDRVLLGKPDETKAKVLELLLRLGISPEDELFLVMIALGQLQVLVEDTPNDWQALFVKFQEELRSGSAAIAASMSASVAALTRCQSVRLSPRASMAASSSLV